MNHETDQKLLLPPVRKDLTIQAVSESEYVVKRKERREYFSIGAQEAFLLQSMAEEQQPQQIQLSYRERFRDDLTQDDLREFSQLLRQMDLLEQTVRDVVAPTDDKYIVQDGRHIPSVNTDRSAGHPAPAAAVPPTNKRRPEIPGKQSWLFFRIPIWNPDEFLRVLVQWTPFLWTRAFLVFVGCIALLAMMVTVSDSHHLAASLNSSRTIETAFLFVVVMLVCTSLHELAHGAALKRFGGEVPEIGFLFMFFTPCMYCNVSDAWLIREKSRRLIITAAGPVCDLCLWAISVFVWRLTVPASSISQLSFLVMTVCGGRTLLNVNPLLRMDGYYLVSDWLSIPNLRPRAMEYWMSHLRWILWGAARPPSVSDGKKLLVYGLMCWIFAIVFLDLIFLRFFEYMGGQFGFTGLLFVLLLLGFGFRRVFRGFLGSELGMMLKTRPGRTAVWCAAAGCLLLILFVVPVRSTTSGEFEVRPGSVQQIHVPVTGILQQVFVEDGMTVEEGQLLAVLSSPDLDAGITRTEDLLREVEANLARLKVGTRPEEIAAQKESVRRAEEWYDSGLAELEQFREAHQHELQTQKLRIHEVTAELENVRMDYTHSESLYRQGAYAGAQLRSDRLQIVQLETRLAQAQAALAASEALGIRIREAEVKRRLQDLDAEKDRLSLMQAGSRREDIAAEEARRERVRHELDFLLVQRDKLKLVATATGTLVAPRLAERVGTVAHHDSVFGMIERPGTSRVEIAVSEDDAAHVSPGQPVTLKARALPFETFEATVEGISATAAKTDSTGRNVVVIHCQINDSNGRLKSGMTGFGRVLRGERSMGVILLTRGIKYLRTEFWW